jgi:hypothetical protein
MKSKKHNISSMESRRTTRVSGDLCDVLSASAIFWIGSTVTLLVPILVRQVVYVFD